MAETGSETETNTPASSSDSRRKREEFEKNTEKTLAAHFTVSGLFIFLSFLNVFKRVPVYNSTSLVVDGAEVACAAYLGKLSKDSWRMGKKRAAVVAAIDGGLSLYQAATGLISNNFWSFWSQSQDIGQASMPWLYTANAIQAWAIAINTGITLNECYKQQKNPKEFIKSKLEEFKISNDKIFLEDAIKIAKIEIKTQLGKSDLADKNKLINDYLFLFEGFLNEAEIRKELSGPVTEDEIDYVKNLYLNLEKRVSQLEKEFGVSLLTALASTCLAVDKQEIITVPDEMIEASIYTIFCAAVMVAILFSWGMLNKCFNKICESEATPETEEISAIDQRNTSSLAAKDKVEEAEFFDQGENLVIAAEREGSLEPQAVTIHLAP